ncbi:hypothetical protein [Chryseobacterium sp. MA9]|uniref:hypothetical protein n=1 Tax=Chryseobacterium sp. MA9 TaxID=2966625 RepID=UPI002105A439|nr:hypothetical protein [Chryseobacterium sp. MA9]UTX50748.1 hypothetical protein KIK00_10965 [Chryseobacterium sp. MA9]
MEKTLIQKLWTTIFSINFDFTSKYQQEILRYLQMNNYKLVGYKGASGPNQISSGVPAWFSIYYTEMFGYEEIDCEPKYKVYVYNKGVIDINTTIQMQAISAEIPLGTAVTFHQDGSFSTTTGAPAEAITVKNERGVGTSDITIGLAAAIKGRFQPFCAFTCAPQGEVIMKPNDNIVLFAVQKGIVPGSVTCYTAGSGCNFIFSAQNDVYDLQMIPGTYGIENAPGKAPVKSILPGTLLVELLNIL